MQPALAAQPEEAGLRGVHPRAQRRGGVDIAHRDIALLDQRVFRQVMQQHVGAHIDVGPVGDGVELEASVLHLQHLDAAAAAGLATPQAGVPAAHLQFAQRPLHRLDLAQLVVAAQAVAAGFPQAAEARLHPGDADAGTVHPQVQPEQLDQLVGIAVGLREQVAGIDQEYRDVRTRLRQQMQGDRRLHAEAGRQCVRAGQVLQRPGDARLRAHPLQVAVDRIEFGGRKGGGVEEGHDVRGVVRHQAACAGSTRTWVG